MKYDAIGELSFYKYGLGPYYSNPKGETVALPEHDRLKPGMTVNEVESVIGKPTSYCEWYNWPETRTDIFCYSGERLTDKNTGLRPLT